MSVFRILFGIEEKEVRSCCVVMPLIAPGILEQCGVGKPACGRLYAAASNSHLTVIAARVGAGFVGDAVLYLKDTGCRTVFLFGSCGLVKQTARLRIGATVVPSSCRAQESFSRTLAGERIPVGTVSPDARLYASFRRFAAGKAVGVRCLTVSSLKLEEQALPEYLKAGIEAVDMECSAFFAAAAHAGLRSLALFYASDILKVKPFYRAQRAAERYALTSGIRTAADLLIGFAAEASAHNYQVGEGLPKK
jgi:uridine phosphorylase